MTRNDIEKDIREYCDINNISDVESFICSCLLKGFNIERYGLSPIDNIRRQNCENDENADSTVIKRKGKIIIKEN